ncbi:MAG: rRNA pseudouridine synthase [Candidatus Glassbacteria bacterium]|nr:rRNA pseudouridine synthase [Candidatus Glassbacteria bacterium]
MTETPAGEKIQKVLAHAGVSSRRGAEKLILEGRVRLNGRTLTDPAIRVDPDTDKLEIDGKPLPPPPEKPAALILYKKIGYVTSRADPHNKNTVYDLLPPEERGRNWLYAGRLDKNSEGLVLFTSSGALVQRLTHPSFKVEKQYTVRVHGNPGPGGLEKMLRGMEIEGKLLKADSVRKTGFHTGEGTYEVVLSQGEKRQIRRMFAELGCQVRYLCRTRIGPVGIEGLAPGQSRRLTDAELRRLLGDRSGAGRRRRR